MKYSGVKWIGDIPDNWEIKKVKHCFYISKEQAHEENPTILSLARSGIKVRDISNNEGQLAASYDNYNPVKPGDLLLNPMDLYSGANCNMSEVSGVISPAYINLRPKADLNPKFFDYFFKTQYWAMAMFAHGKGVSFDNRWTMNAETLLNYYLPFPHLTIQNKIVSFLNDRKNNIEELIDIENEQIALLEEYKECMIKDVVTKGIDISEEMVNTNSRWLLSIPKSWKFQRFKYCHSGTNVGESIDKTFVVDDGGYVFYTAGLNSVRVSYKDFPIEKLTTKSDLLMSRNGNPYVFIPLENAMYSDHVIRVTVKKEYNKEFIKYALQSSIQFEKAQGVSIVTWNASIWNEQELPIPPIAVQNQIVEFITKESAKIDNLIFLKQQKIISLNQYFQSLVYECVTGKIEADS